MNSVLSGNRNAKLADCLFVVLSGNAWITRENGTGDLILREGRSKKLHGRGWVVQGLPTGSELQYRTWPIRSPEQTHPNSPTISAWAKHARRAANAEGATSD
jgi:hypothetical protein